MSYELTKISKLSDSFTSFYSIYCDESKDTLYDEFFLKYINIKKYRKKMGIANLNIRSMSAYKGAKDHFFKSPDEKVCYIYFAHWLEARLYCLRFSEKLVILGSGGLLSSGKLFKSSQIAMDLNRNKMDEILKAISNKMDAGIISITSDGLDFVGILKF